MIDKVQKIREEVERLKLNLIHGACASQIAMETRCKEEAYDEVISLIDSLQEESVSEELEKAAKENAKIERSDDTEVGYDINRFGGFVDGANWQKQQMMAKAVDVTVHIDTGGYPYIPQLELYDYDNDLPLAKEGDKYKVVVIKEEESV